MQFYLGIKTLCSYSHPKFTPLSSASRRILAALNNADDLYLKRPTAKCSAVVGKSDSSPATFRDVTLHGERRLLTTVGRAISALVAVDQTSTAMRECIYPKACMFSISESTYLKGVDFRDG